MKYFYSFFSIILLLTGARAQVANGFIEQFESMTPNAPPSSGWLAAGGFSVMGSPHGKLNGSQINGLSKRLFTNSGISNCDSVLSQKVTNVNTSLWNMSFDYRICDWSGGVPLAATTLNAGDTCYFDILKYSGSVIISRTNVYKIYKTNHFQSGTSFSGINYVPDFWSYPCTTNDTLRLCIKVKRGASGDYWYDFDNILFGPTVSVKEVNAEMPMIYPNPTPANLNIRLNGGEKLSSVRVLNSAGQTVFLQEKFGGLNAEIIDLNWLESGLYVAEITLQNGHKTVTKVLKE
jgi:hypothetical protein